MKKVRVVVSGRVQGVWFRASTYDKAKEFGVNGYVRNTISGDVEFVAEGEDSKVDRLIQWARHGPPLARVDHIEVVVLEYDNEYPDFSVRH
ncbi:MAG: acylphosphatase [Candidatus Neomarinimicrobiota bacterium]